MDPLNKLMRIYLCGRLRAIEQFSKNPISTQQRQLDYLLLMGGQTIFGRERGMKNMSSIEQFQQGVEVSEYEDFFKYIERTKGGENGVLWPTKIKWFAKSSGTTNAKSKFIPVSNQGLRDAHTRGPRDVLALFADRYPSSGVFRGKTLTLGGSRKIEKEGESALSGDLSAILIENTPRWVRSRRIPSVEAALTPDFDKKIELICRETVGQNVTMFAGVPSWNLVMMNRILEYTGKSNLLEVWPNMELFIHGGVNFKPYQELYRKLIPSPDMKYMDTYNASEGFFSIADDPRRDDMLLMLDYSIFYEFIPLKHLKDHSKAIPLEGVELGVNYAMVITTSSGLWRYMIGDTVRFTSLAPYRIMITGRTKHYINAFGEEVMVENTERALRVACDATGAEVMEFSVAPIYMEGRDKGAHQWVIEFQVAPSSIELFTGVLDKTLQSVNSDYEAKRFKDTTLNSPKINIVPSGTFFRWMQKQGKTGGQNKVPRLYNDRTFVEQLLKLAEKE